MASFAQQIYSGTHSVQTCEPLLLGHTFVTVLNVASGSSLSPLVRWPRMLIQVYAKDSNGKRVMRGYGSVLIPTFTGARTCYVHLFKPKSSTILQVSCTRRNSSTNNHLVAPLHDKPTL